MSGNIDGRFHGELARVTERVARLKSLGGKNIGGNRRGGGGKRGARSGRQKVRVAVNERRRVDEDCVTISLSPLLPNVHFFLSSVIYIKKREKLTRRHRRRIGTRPLRVSQDFLVNIGLASFLDTLNLVETKEGVGDWGWECAIGRWRAANGASRSRQWRSRRE
jgi:hypothetical protein